jgi:tetratricopeptide (TPR) repeat protein
VGPDDSAAALDESIRILDQLMASHPKDSRFRFELADTLSVTMPWRRSSSDEGSRPRLQRAVALGQELSTAFPGIPEYRALLANSLVKLAAIERADDDLQAANDSQTQALSLLLPLVEQFPAVPAYRFALTRSLGEQGSALREQGNLSDSRAVLETGIQRFESALEKGGQKNSFTDRALGNLYAKLAETLREAGDTTAADDAARKARELGERAWPHAPGFHRHP